MRADLHVRAWLNAVADPDIYTSTLVIGELRRGVLLLTAKDAAQAHALDVWLSRVQEAYSDRILGVDLPVALMWAELTARRRLPVVDGLLAATALAHDMVLVTRNVRDIAGTNVTYLNPFESRRVRRAR